MQIYDDRKNRIGILSGFRNRTVTSTLNSGDKELSFEYPAHGDMVDILQEEYYIRTKTDEYVLRAVEKTEDWNKYTAQLNVEELEGKPFPYGFVSQEQTIKACLEFAFEGTGWMVGACEIKKRRTISIEESTTAWVVFQQCLSTYRCECKINSLNKRVDIYETIGQDRGCYFIEGLNLRKLTINSDTYEFYTRIIPIGKDGITIEGLSENAYLENYQYSRKEKTYTWKDERYTNTTSLMEDATAKLEEMSRPYRAYTADVVDLAKTNPEYSDILDYGIGDSVTLVSKRTGTREKQRIVKIVENPENPEKNTVELSNITKTFAEVQKTETELAKQEAIAIAHSKTQKILKDDYYDKKEVESHITASAEKISLGVSETYETKEVVREKYNVAVQAGQDAADAAEAAANQATDEKLTEYSTTEQMQAAINLSAQEIGLSVLKTYETKQNVTDKYNAAVQAGQNAADAAEAAANQATDEKLTEYSTTEQMQAAISLSEKKINLSVSQNYAKKAELALTLDEKTGIATLSGEADCIKLTSGQLIIESGGMTLDASGNATFYGKVSSTDGVRKTEVNKGFIRFTKDETETGRISPIAWGNDYENNEGVMFSTVSNYLALGYPGATGWAASYILNNGLNPNGYRERSIFYGETRFIDQITAMSALKIKSDIIVSREGTTEARVNLFNDKHSGRVVASSNGNFGLYDITNNKWIIYSDEDGTINLPSCLIAEGSTAYGRFNIYDENLYLNKGVYNSKPGVFVKGGGIFVDDFIACGGTKSRAVKTENYGTVCLNAFEMPTPYFGDIGSGKIGTDGTATVFLEPIFAETIESNCEYQVLLTNTGRLKVSYAEKQNGFFIVYGEAGATFDWMVCAIQKGYVGMRSKEISVQELETAEEFIV